MREQTRCGVVLAAGFGSRLQNIILDGVPADAPILKPLTPVAGVPLIFRTIRSLALAGCERVIIVLGFGAEKIEQQILKKYDSDVSLTFVINDKFEKQNGVSLLAAADAIGQSEFILTMADHVFGDAAMLRAKGLKLKSNTCCLFVDYNIRSVFDLDDATKVLSAEDESITSIGKHLRFYNCIDTGLFVCSPVLIESLRAVYDQRGDASLSEGVKNLAQRGLMFTQNINGAFWQDVDTPEMLAYAQERLSEPEPMLLT